MPTFLETVIAHTRERLAARRADLGEPALRERLSGAPAVRSFADALVVPGMSLIAEMKRASPSKGMIHAGAPVAPIVTAYAAAPAAA